MAVIFTLLALPNEQVLSESNLNLKEFYQEFLFEYTLDDFTTRFILGAVSAKWHGNDVCWGCLGVKVQESLSSCCLPDMGYFRDGSADSITV